MTSPSLVRDAVMTVSLAILVALTPTQSARAQSLGRMLVENVSHSAGDIWAVWTSPFHATRRDWLYTAGAFGVSAAVSPLDAGLDRWVVRHEDDGFFNFLSPFREGGDAFSGRTVTPIAVGLLVLSFATRSEPLQDGVFGCLSSYLASYGVRHYVAYPLVSRVRPDSSRDVPSPPAKNGDQYDISIPGSTDWGKRSFPGGHVANVTTCAAFLTERFDMGVFDALPWLIVGSVGTARILDRRHWLSDQTIGVLFGYAVGKEVALRSLRRKNQKNRMATPETGGLFLEPGQEGVRVGWRREF